MDPRRPASREAIGFIGLGALGAPIAGNLIDAGHALRVHNRTASKADPLVARGATRADRPCDAVTKGGIVVTLVWDGAALEGIVASDGFLEGLGAGTHISMSTVAPETARRVAELHRTHGSAYVEAPVFGRPEAAAAKQLWMPIAGARAAKERVRPLLTDMGAQGVFDFGEDAGAAVTVKLAGNFMIISATRTMAEALALATRSGLDPHAVVGMLTSTLFTSPIHRSYGKALADGAKPMASDIPLKDLGLFVETAAAVESPSALSTFLRETLRARG